MVYGIHHAIQSVPKKNSQHHAHHKTQAHCRAAESTALQNHRLNQELPAARVCAAAAPVASTKRTPITGNPAAHLPHMANPRRSSKPGMWLKRASAQNTTLIVRHTTATGDTQTLKDRHIQTYEGSTRANSTAEHSACTSFQLRHGQGGELRATHDCMLKGCAAAARH